MIIGHKIQIKPTKEQEEIFWRRVGATRFIYNWYLNLEETRYKNEEKMLGKSATKELTKLKKQEGFEWLKELCSKGLEITVHDGVQAYQNWFRDLKKSSANVSKKPRFKSRKRSRTSFPCNPQNFSYKDGFVQLSKIGKVKALGEIPDAEKYSNVRVSHDGKHWYVSFGLETEFETQELTAEVVGIDLGIKDLATCSNGNVYKNINKYDCDKHGNNKRTIKKLEKRLKRKQRQISRKYEMNKQGNKFVKTNNILRLEQEIKMVHRRLTNIRKSYTHHVTSEIIKRKPSKIVLEDLNIKGMMKNKHLAKSVAQQNLYEFIRQINYKAQKYGIEVITADRWFPSSKTCSSCGTIKSDLKLKDRVFKCDCGFIVDRDLNAAINLKNLAM